MSYAEPIGTAILRGVGWLYRPPLFGKFLRLEEIKHKILQAVQRKEETFPDLVISYVSTAFLFPRLILENIRWEFIFLLFSLATSKSVPKVQIPLLKPGKSKDKKDAWDYEGRTYAMYVHILANAYGWTKQEIDNLDVDHALALVQEIITDEQLDREFLWSMSDKSYIYNYQTKSGKPNPLERPYFMHEEVLAPKKTKILKSMMPQGKGTYAPTPEDLKAKNPNLKGI